MEFASLDENSCAEYPFTLENIVLNVLDLLVLPEYYPEEIQRPNLYIKDRNEKVTLHRFPTFYTKKFTLPRSYQNDTCFTLLPKFLIYKLPIYV